MALKLEHAPILIAVGSAFCLISGYAFELGYFTVVGPGFLNLLTISDYLASALNGIVLSVSFFALGVGLFAAQGVGIYQRLVRNGGQPDWRKFGPWLLVLTLFLEGVGSYLIYRYQPRDLNVSVGAFMRRQPIQVSSTVIFMFVPLLLSIYLYLSSRSRSALVLTLIALSAVFAYFMIVFTIGSRAADRVLRQVRPDFVITVANDANHPEAMIFIHFLSAGILCKKSGDAGIQLIRWEQLQSFSAVSSVKPLMR